MPDPCLDPAPEIDLTITGSPGALHAEVVPSLDPYNGVERRADGLWTPGRAPVVTAIPASAADGDEILLVADSGNNILWHLRYVASEPTAFKWLAIGAPAIASRRKQTGTMAPGGANDWVTLSGTDVAGPSVVLPAGGFYSYRFGAQVNSNADGNSAQVGISPQGFDPLDDDVAANANTRDASVSSLVTAYNGFGGQTAGTSMRLMYRCSGSGGTATFKRRWLEVTPYKLG